MMMTCDNGRGPTMPAAWTGALLLSLAIGCGPAGEIGESGADGGERSGNNEGPGFEGDPSDGSDDNGGADSGSGGVGLGSGGGGALAGGGGYPIDPDPGIGCNLAWSSGFETGFPGSEWLDFDGGGYSPNGTLNPGYASGWTIVDRASGEPVFSGDHSYRGWIERAATKNHRPYPVIHTDIPTPLVNTFMVYLDADYSRLIDGKWIHFGTWGNANDQGGGLWALHTMSVQNRRLEFAHTNPLSGEYIGPFPQPDFPLGRWVRLTVYLEYNGNNGFVQVWQDGVPMLRAQISKLGSSPGTALTRAHWGMYADSRVDHGTQYNDEIKIWSLDAPLSDLDTEPDCYLAP